MSNRDPYAILLSDPVWGREVRLLEDLPESVSAQPVVVGGAIRDLILNRPIKDLDIATSDPDAARGLAAAFAQATKRKLIVYSHEQTIYRVVAAGLPQIDFTDPVGGSLESDLRRRDFTINALGLGLVGNRKGEIIDLMSGRDDLSHGIVRAASDGVFDDDPIRMLRAFRFRAELNFKIHPDTLNAIGPRAFKLKNVAGERIQLELIQALAFNGSAELVEDMDRMGLLEDFFPDLPRMKGIEQNDYHHLNVWQHTLETLRQIEQVFRFDGDILKPYRERLTEYIDFEYPSGHLRKSLIKLGMLLHDIAKPHCRAVRDDGKITFIGHEKLGAELVKGYLSDLKFPIYERDFIVELIAGHLRVILLSQESRERPRFAYRFFRDFGDVSVAIALISLADRFAAQGPLVTDEINQRHKDSVAFLLKCLYEQTDIVVRPPQLIDGNMLKQELNLYPGPLVGYFLRQVREAQAAGEVKTKEDAIEFCRKLSIENNQDK